ncbi:cupin domain-containing protein [Polaromonas sp.]|uniref:cupin domain-containing protein n=1 Tax=Polaromonas sp. TaxID=1869339 RepID=UPI003750D834
MALKHAQAMDVIDLLMIGAHQERVSSTSLLKTSRIQLIRMALPAGHVLPEHHVPGEITIHCLSGEAEVTTPTRASRLAAGTLVMLPAAEPHGVRAFLDTLLLVTVFQA